MKSTMARVLAVLALTALAGLPSYAEDYQCENAAGCTATITEDGKLRKVSFRKGDIVSTQAGWIVHPDDGWRKLKPDPGPPEQGA